MNSKSDMRLEPHLIRVLHTGGYEITKLPSVDVGDCEITVKIEDWPKEWGTGPDKLNSEVFESIRLYFHHRAAAFATVVLVVRAFYEQRACVLRKIIETPNAVVLLLSSEMRPVVAALFLEGPQTINILVA